MNVIRVPWIKTLPYLTFTLFIFESPDSPTTDKLGNRTTEPITDDQSDVRNSGLSKIELVAVIVLPIIALCTILLVSSLIVWCRKRRLRAENMQYCKYLYKL